ncbi:MAG: C-GCAxxG-C-C family protein [Candidatus Heimdallarchaeaceae archaeon]
MKDETKAIIEEALKYWETGINCSRSTSCGALDHYNFKEQSNNQYKALMAFGGGIGEGSICGSITGSICALSLILSEYGLTEEQILAKIQHFKDQFRDKFGTLYCRDILVEFQDKNGEIDMDHPERRLRCTKTVKSAVSIVQSIIESVEREQIIKLK